MGGHFYHTEIIDLSHHGLLDKALCFNMRLHVPINIASQNPTQCIKSNSINLKKQYDYRCVGELRCLHIQARSATVFSSNLRKQIKKIFSLGKKFLKLIFFSYFFLVPYHWKNQILSTILAMKYFDPSHFTPLKITFKQSSGHFIFFRWPF